jgi:hypothetical protein
MRINEIAKMHTTISKEELDNHAKCGCMGVHESIFRSYQTLQFVKECLKKDWPSEAILAIVDSIEAR